MTSLTAVVKLYHRSQLLVRSEFDDKPATPSDDADNATSSNILRIGPLVEVLKLPGGTATHRERRRPGVRLEAYRDARDVEGSCPRGEYVVAPALVVYKSPILVPTKSPADKPTLAPSNTPTKSPMDAPNESPTVAPTKAHDDAADNDADDAHEAAHDSDDADLDRHQTSLGMMSGMAATGTPMTNAKSSTDSTSRIMPGLYPPLECAARPRTPESFGVGDTEDTRCAAPGRERLGVALTRVASMSPRQLS